MTKYLRIISLLWAITIFFRWRTNFLKLFLSIKKRYLHELKFIMFQYWKIVILHWKSKRIFNELWNTKEKNELNGNRLFYRGWMHLRTGLLPLGPEYDASRRQQKCSLHCHCINYTDMKHLLLFIEPNNKWNVETEQNSSEKSHRSGHLETFRLLWKIEREGKERGEGWNDQRGRGLGVVQLDWQLIAICYRDIGRFAAQQELD